MDLSDTVALIGAVTGPLGLLLGLLVYFRDRAVVQVSLQWDLELYGPSSKPDAAIYMITIRNIGRRTMSATSTLPLHAAVASDL